MTLIAGAPHNDARAAKPGGAGAPREATGTDASERGGISGFIDGLDPKVRTAAIAGGCVAALAGYALLKRPIQSKVIGAVDGVELLSNPRLPGRVRASWEVPATGSVWGPPPGAKVSIEHVDQGALGDCWNVAGKGAIAHRRPAALEAMVDARGDHVLVHFPGRSVAVTKELPIGSKGGPAFAGGGNDDPVYWPAYIEKAQAAISRNGYRSLEGGVAATTFRQLLGSDPVRTASRGTIADDVAHHVAEGNPVAVATLNRETRRMKALNIKANHYYVPVEVTGAGADRKVQLFNPWGEKHPTGPIGVDDLRAIFSRLDTPDEVISYRRFG